MSETPPTAPTAEAHGAAAAPENTLASAPERAPEHSLDGAPEAAPHDAPAAAAPRAPELGPAQVGALLAERFPALFGAGRALPIKLRIQADIQQRAPGLLSKKSLSIFLHRHTTSTPYLKALVALPQRIDLDGAPAGEIAAEHRAAAAAELERRRALLEARRAAER
ncbi:MAG: ProQ/FinO family protein, partial [Burkholderiales bacterium]|nr:ProQ/FinO family protein [Burkholderiales bacterium]